MRPRGRKTAPNNIEISVCLCYFRNTTLLFCNGTGMYQDFLA